MKPCSFSAKNVHFSILLGCLLALLSLALADNCDFLEIANLTKILPQTWSSLAWDKVDLISWGKIQMSDYQNLMRESSKESINLRLTILGNSTSSIPKDTKSTMISSCSDDYRFLTTVIKSVKPSSALIVFTKTGLAQTFLDMLKKFDWTNSFYLLDIYR